jgi:hypothetical protein
MSGTRPVRPEVKRLAESPANIEVSGDSIKISFGDRYYEISVSNLMRPQLTVRKTMFPTDQITVTPLAANKIVIN